MAWLWLVIAGLFEIIFAVLLKLSDNFSKTYYVVAFLIAALISLYSLSKAMIDIPLGTAYAVWTGIGAVGVVILGIILFSDPVSFYRLFFLSTLIISIIGLKLVSSH